MHQKLTPHSPIFTENSPSCWVESMGQSEIIIIQSVLAQLFQQHLVGGFKAAQVDLFVFDYRRIQHAAHQPFGQRIRYAHVKEQVDSLR